MIEEAKIQQIIDELDNYYGLVETGDEAFEIVEMKLRKLLI